MEIRKNSCSIDILHMSRIIILIGGDYDDENE